MSSIKLAFILEFCKLMERLVWGCVELANLDDACDKVRQINHDVQLIGRKEQFWSFLEMQKNPLEARQPDPRHSSMRYLN